jgi:hypothetical protein
MFLDAAVYMHERCKLSTICGTILVTCGVFVMDILIHSGNDQVDVCWISCSNVHTLFVFALLQTLLFQFKYAFRCWYYPRRCSILFVPLLYQANRSPATIAPEIIAVTDNV